MVWDPSAEAWYLRHGVFRAVKWNGKELGVPVVGVELPASELERCVIPQAWPPMAWG